jgi:hypothetical protein
MFNEVKVMMKIIILGLVMIAANSANAADLFDNGKPANFSQRDLVTPSTTIGGYPIYKGADQWIYISGEVHDSRGQADPIPLGTVTMIHVEEKRLIAAQSITANLSNNTNAAYWGGAPCAGAHLHTSNRSVGRNDNCLTIDPVAVDIGGVINTFINIKIVSSAGSGRLYNVDFMINAAFLGFEKTTISDWTQAAVFSSPVKSQLLNRLGVWSEKYLDATKNVLDYSKSAGVFENVPNFKSLAHL